MHLIPVPERLRGMAAHRERLHGEGYRDEHLKEAVRAGALQVYRCAAPPRHPARTNSAGCRVLRTHPGVRVRST